MTRADFWCRVLGWLQIGGAVAVGLAIYTLWSVFFGWVEIDDGGFFTLVMWLFLLAMAFPAFLSGVLTLSFAQCVEKARAGANGDDHVLLRVFLALAGLWSAGAVGFMGLNLPPFGFFAVLGVTSAFLAIMGHEWTAELLEPRKGAA
jgi:hypothetical protein